MVKYYEFQKMQSMTANLKWDHWIELLVIKNVDEIKYYINQAEVRCLTTRKLRELIKSDKYNSLSIESKAKYNNQELLDAKDIIPNPIIIKNKDNIEIINERVLKQLILEDIDGFLLELGNNFCYIGNEYKIKLGDRYNYIDLLLYNIEFNCYVVVELKVKEQTKQLPNMNLITHGKEFCNDDYNGYNLSYLAVRYLSETLSKEEFEILMSQFKIIKNIGENIIENIFKYYDEKFICDNLVENKKRII